MKQNGRMLVTGASGFVGGYVAERAAREGWKVRTLVRRHSDRSLLERWGVECVEGDLTDAASVRRAVEGCTVVVHCAAKVGDWGPLDEFRRVNVDGTRTLLEAARDAGVRRFLHTSSLGVYPMRHHFEADESFPIRPQGDPYARTKAESELLALEFHRRDGLPVTVLRPGFVYGPRDRHVLPRLLQKLREGRVWYLGDGQQLHNTTYVENLLDVYFLALRNERSVGQVYNVTDGVRITKREFFELLCAETGYPTPKKHLPLWLAKVLVRVFELRARWRRQETLPVLTRASLRFLGLNWSFSVEKARLELGYDPRYSPAEGIKKTVAWFREQGLV